MHSINYRVEARRKFTVELWAFIDTNKILDSLCKNCTRILIISMLQHTRLLISDITLG